MFDKKNDSHLGYSISINHGDFNAVKSGRGVYAWIEHRGMFYYGDIPGVSGILHSNMAHSFEECFDEMERKLNGCISIRFASFRQKVSFEQIAKEHPNAEIVFIPIMSKR